MNAKRKTKEDVIKILQEVYDEYIISDDILYYRLLINRKGLSTTAFSNWCNKNIPEIDDMVEILEDLQESVIVNEMLLKSGKVNVTAGIFWTKCRRQWIEHEKLLVIESKEIVNTEETTISIEFEEI